MAEGQAWEGELRRCLTDQVSGAATARTDLAGAAIGRARRAQRRRLTTGLVAVVGATVLATGVLWQGLPGMGSGEYGAITRVIGDPVTDDPPAVEVRLAAGDQLPVDLRTDVIGHGTHGGTVLATASGQTVALPGVWQVTAGYRVGEGWAVIGGEPGLRRLWWVTADQPPVSLLAGMDAIVLDGPRVAWQQGALLATAELSDAGALDGRTSTIVPGAGGHLVDLVGETVLLRPESVEGGGWGTWQPGHQPRWAEEAAWVYGMLPDGATAVGLTAAPSGDRLCLAEFTSAPTLAVTRTRCLREELSPGHPAAVSPDGSWLLAGTSRQAVLIDLTTVFTASPAAVIPVAGVAPPQTAPVWLSADRVLLAGSDELVQLRLERLADQHDPEIDRFPLAGVPPVVTVPG